MGEEALLLHDVFYFHCNALLLIGGGIKGIVPFMLLKEDHHCMVKNQKWPLGKPVYASAVRHDYEEIFY